jgi:hypothetical protein
VRGVPAALLLLGCGGPAADSGEDAADDELQAQVPAGARVLAYRGHGGASGDGTGRGSLTELEALVEDELGYPVDWRDYLPEDLSDYRAILLMGSGMEGEQAYSAAEIEAFRAALDQGARLVLLAEVETCGLSVYGDLLAGLGLSMGLSGEGLDQYRILDALLVDPDHPILAGVDALTLTDPCFLDLGLATPLAKDEDRHTLMAVERPAARPGATALPGDVVLVGDFQFLDDGGLLEEPGHRQLVANLVEVAP